MTTHSCRDVKFSELFKGLNSLRTAFEESDPDFNWGGNDHSLVTPRAITDHCANTIGDHRQLKALQRRIEKLPSGVYVDLEN